MGCWDIYCFLCGNTCHSSFFTKESFLEDVEYYESNKKKNKWFINYFKPIYELYTKDSKMFIKKNLNLKIQSKWLNKCTFLTTNNKIIHGCKEISCNIDFKDKNGNIYNHETFGGVFVHTDCWKFIDNEYKLKLNYSFLPIININQTCNKIFDFVNYGLIENYWNQNFEFITIIADSNEELCISPLKSNIVAKNIKKVFSQLKIKNDPMRKSPHVSATFYNNGIYKVGSNKNIWTVKFGKWMEIKSTITLKLVNPKFKINSFYGDFNKEPIFIIKKTINKKNIEYDIVTTQDYSTKL